MVGDAHRLELAVWSICAVVAASAMVCTFSSDFEARVLALEGEATTLVVVLVLAAASVWRHRRYVLRSGASVRVQLAGVTMRVSLGVPLFLFALVVAASGFAA